MTSRDPTVWMWEQALELLDRAERLQRRFFLLRHARQLSPSWEPPIDVFEDDVQLVILVALPGVQPDQLAIGTEGPALVIRGERLMPDCCRQASISRLEIPHGYFERRIELPAGQFKLSQQELKDGCLTLTLTKSTRSGEL